MQGTGDAMGLRRGRIAVLDRAPVELWQIFYP